MVQLKISYRQRAKTQQAKNRPEKNKSAIAYSIGISKQ